MDKPERQDKRAERLFVSDIKAIIEKGRQLAYASVNTIAIDTYWKIGERIVRQEQGGKDRATYGKHIIVHLARQLQESYGEEFAPRRLREYRQFYLKFSDREIWHACVPNLTWTHFRVLLREEDPAARVWYMREAMQDVGTRAPWSEISPPNTTTACS